ncbi:MAG TPA: cation diffusion facilitator family transporter [Cyclobacteriaceae bacterium]
MESDSHHHHHHATQGKNLSFAFWINTCFAVIELVGGLYTNSVAILSDSLHDLGDSISLGMAYYFHKVSAKKSDQHFSYGYKRFSLVGALINAIILIIGCVFILLEAIERIGKPEHANAKGMLVLALLGIVFNLMALLRLKKGDSINEKVISLHFIEDILGWVAVLIGSVVMLFIDLPILDPLLSISIMAFILFNVYKNLRHLFRIILQGIPLNIDIENIKKQILAFPDVIEVHDVHAWSMDGEYNVMSLHLVLKNLTPLTTVERIKKDLRHSLEHLNVQHVTIETEFENEICSVVSEN